MTQPRAPIPRKPNPTLLQQVSSSTPISPVATPAPASPRLASLLDALLEDCVLQSLDSNLLCPPRIEYVKQFHRFLRERHCHENLSFLIEVFRYKYFYDKIAPVPAATAPEEAAHTLFKPSFLDQLLELSIENLQFPSLSIRRAVRSISHSRSNSVANVALPFPFELDDDDHTPSSASAWDTLKDSYLSSETSSLELAASDRSCTLSEKTSLLHEQWAMIVERYIEPNSPEQVNVCATTAHRIMDADSLGVVHPSVFGPAKVEVIDLLRENAYHAFLSASPAPVCVCHSGLSQSHSPKRELAVLGLAISLRMSTPAVASAPLEPPSTRSQAVSPSPHYKRRNKLLSQLSGSFDDVSGSSGSSLSLSGIIHHFKHHSRTNTASPHLMPSSGLKTGSPASPTDVPGSHALTPRDNTLSPTFLDKLLKKKRSP